ncbi:p-hydroxycinnamoyl CoA hydratase/lyase [Caballeronia terrestris]|uniref:p-hydroxycinnamoyl CoA hydratase/lyase n=1 Tax=Caballeronia terrestris TaxID=1226301 RepID=A0A158KN96_9BURK|nr:enoyl-CoA hydratase/isomerase family protein [Caballeronia terrestris]SAL82554.1 p-hydroxycinnamoyl CoA hydratase/lyase [Caballeronia terrestris]
MTGILETGVEERSWTFTLNRPDKLNALNAELVEALIEGVSKAHEAGARLLVFAGNGKSFSAGFDQGELERESDADLLMRLVRIESLLHLVASSPCLTVPFAQGRNFGAGVDLFATCRQRYSTHDASFRMPGLRFGLVLGTRRFGALVGHRRAREVLEQTSTISAAEAFELGLVTRLINEAERASATDDARRIASLLDRETQQHLYHVLSTEQADQDMANLVRSAARPGLKSRMLDYIRQG